MEEKIKEKTQEAKETIKENRPMKTVEDSRTEQVHLIMHQHLNAGGRLFGGMLMQWVDEVSGVVAMRHCGTYRVTTAAVDNLQFKEPVYEGEILVMIGYVTYVGILPWKWKLIPMWSAGMECVTWLTVLFL